MRRIVPLIAALAALFIAPAFAGDQSTLNRLGFTDDGSIYAFEEYGIQDGSGFPYANRFYINTADDSFVSGTPIRVRIDDEAASVDDARAQAASEGEAAVVADDALQTGFLAGFSAVTELSADPLQMIVNPRPVEPPVDDALAVYLEEKQFTAEGSCEGIAPSVAGFRLLATHIAPGASMRVLHDDDSVPSSRACPLGYRIGGIETFYPDKAPAVYAVLIAVRSFGFEGPDYRWMAVTAAINE